MFNIRGATELQGGPSIGESKSVQLSDNLSEFDNAQWLDFKKF
jgi:hypothetical protein